MGTEQRYPADRPDAPEEVRNQDGRDDATKAEGGAATGALAGAVVGGPVGLAVGAAVGSAAGGAAEAADPSDDRHEEHGDFERAGSPDDARSYDLRDPRMGGHVGGSDPEHA
jgi:hypothetical protein